MMKAIIAGAIMVQSVSVCLAEGIEITLESKNLQKKETVLTQKMYVLGEKIAMQNTAENAKVSTIYRGDKQLIWTIFPEKKEYMETTKESMDQLGQTMNTAMEQMKAQMASLPPEQRAMMEKMMQGQMSQATSAAESAPGVTYKKSGEKKAINGYPCVKFEMFRGTEKVRELWVTDWKNIPDLKTATVAFESMGKFMTNMLSSFKTSPFYKAMDNPYSSTSELKGFPILSTEITNGVPTYETAVKQIGKKGIGDEIFNVPSGYTVNSPMGNVQQKKK